MSKEPNSSKSKGQKAGQQPDKSGPQVDFGKAHGSSRHDEADLRDVARKAAKKSQHQNESGKD
jgi:hypothetical protein